MSNNLIINDTNVAKVLKILKYVTLTFNGIPSPVIDKQIPNDLINAPEVPAQGGSIISGLKNYTLLYNWKKQSDNSHMPILVPNIDTTYIPNWCTIKVPTNAVAIAGVPAAVVTVAGIFVTVAPIIAIPAAIITVGVTVWAILQAFDVIEND